MRLMNVGGALLLLVGAGVILYLLGTSDLGSGLANDFDWSADAL